MTYKSCVRRRGLRGTGLFPEQLEARIMLSGQPAPVVPALGYGPLTEQQWSQHLRTLSLQLPGGPLSIPLVYQGTAQQIGRASCWGRV